MWKNGLKNFCTLDVSKASMPQEVLLLKLNFKEYTRVTETLQYC